MKMCPNCGTQSEDNALFCGECGFSFANAPAAPAPVPVQEAQQGTYNAQSYGAPAQEAQQSTYNAQPYGAPAQEAQQGAYNAQAYGAVPPQEPKKKSRVPLYIGIAVAAVAVIGIVAFAVSRLVGGGGKSTDFVGSQKAFLEERTAVLTESTAKDTFSSDVTLSVELNGRGELADIAQELLGDSSIVMKMDSSAKRVLLNAALHLKGSNVLEGFFTMTPDEIGFSIPNADDTWYVMDLETLMDRYDIQTGDLEQNMTPKEAQANIKEIVDRYVAVLSSSIKKESVKREKRDVKLSEVGKTVSCTVMTWTPTEDELVGLFDALAETLETDTQLAELLDVYATQSGEYQDGTDMLEQFADTLRDEAEDTAAQIVDAEFTWIVALDSKSRVSWISISTDQGEVAYERALDAETGAEALYAVSDGYEAFLVLNEYDYKGTQYTGTLSADTPEGAISLDYDIDFSKKSVFGIPYGTYSPDLRALLPGLKLEVTVEDGGKGSTDHIIAVKGLGNLTGDEVTDVTVTLNTTDKGTAKEPDGSKEDISDYSDEELQALFGDLLYEVEDALMSSPEIMELLETIGGGY